MNTTDLTPLSERPNVEQYRKQAKELLAAANSGDEAARIRLLRSHPHPSKLESPYKLADAQVVLARENGFVSWPKFTGFIGAVARADSQVSAFERAADAIVGGDAALLRSRLEADPSLIGAHSERAHRCMLIHYIGSNGFEGYRQKAPTNSLEILNILLDAGAEVDAPADTYGRGTTLGLVATSVHPVRSGVQIPLMDRLIEAGADVNGGSGWPIVPACLHNGRGVAARFLADRGARLDLESAAGVGYLDVVRGFIESGEPMDSKGAVFGFGWACEYGQVSVVEYLLSQGMPVGVTTAHGMTGLHWAAIGGQGEVARLLLSLDAPLDVLNTYGGTPFGQLVWSALHDDGTDFRPVYRAFADAGAVPESLAVLETDLPKLRDRLGI